MNDTQIAKQITGIGAMASSGKRRTDAIRWAHIATVVAFLCGGASLALAWAEARWYVFHPHYLPLCLLYAGLAGSTVFAITCCLWRIVRGPQRLHAAIIAAVALLPAGFWANVGIAAKRNWERRRVPNNLTMRLAKVMGASMMRAGADVKYPRRLETERLVMCFDHLDHPEHDLEVMDRHLLRLENMLGGAIEAKVFWVRGRLLGVQYASFHGLSLGSKGDMNDVMHGGGRGDRHELAHAALDWFREPRSDPPYVLHEGWAMAQCGDGRLVLAEAAAKSRRENPEVGIRELFGPEWYYRDAGSVYSVGGAFVDFLIRSHGAERFRRFYAECQPHSVEAKCLEVFSMDLDELNADFWDDVKHTLADADAGSAADADSR